MGLNLCACLRILERAPVYSNQSFYSSDPTPDRAVAKENGSRYRKAISVLIPVAILIRRMVFLKRQCCAVAVTNRVEGVSGLCAFLVSIQYRHNVETMRTCPKPTLVLRRTVGRGNVCGTVAMTLHMRHADSMQGLDGTFEREPNSSSG
jgi:hypothetical protein